MISPETLATLRDFKRCLDPSTAIVDRHALEEAIAHLSAEPADRISGARLQRLLQLEAMDAARSLPL